MKPVDFLFEKLSVFVCVCVAGRGDSVKEDRMVNNSYSQSFSNLRRLKENIFRHMCLPDSSCSDYFHLSEQAGL